MRHLVKGTVEDIRFVLDIEDGIGTDMDANGILYFAGKGPKGTQPSEFLLEPREMDQLLKEGKLDIPEYAVNPCDFGRVLEELLASLGQGEMDEAEFDAHVAKFNEIETFLIESPIFAQMSRIVLLPDFLYRMQQNALIQVKTSIPSETGMPVQVDQIGLITQIAPYESNPALVEYRLDSDEAYGISEIRRNSTTTPVLVFVVIPVAYDDIHPGNLEITY